MKAFKFLTLSLAVAALCLGYASCGDDDDENSPGDETTALEDDSSFEGDYADEVNGTGRINGHDYVDLGLSVKWATCNVGADSPSDYGDYLAWGETSTKSEYTEDNSRTSGEDMGDIAGNPSYDAACANWGGSWRLPTAEEIDELVDRCDATWTTMNGHNGYKVTGPNGNSIFLPAAGYLLETSLSLTGELGSYWSSTPYESTEYGAYNLRFGDGYFGKGWGGRLGGQSVRPVSE